MKDNNQKKDKDKKCEGMFVLPYVSVVSEKVSRVRKQYNTASAMKPQSTLHSQLVHPKDKRDDLDITNALYSLSCLNCDREYIGETGCKFGTRLKEHKAEVDKVERSVTTRAERKESLCTIRKSAVTDHVVE